YRACVGAILVAWAPPSDRDRTIVDDGVGRGAGFDRGEVKDWLEGRTRLAAGADGAIELASRPGPAADHGADATVVIEHDQSCFSRVAGAGRGCKAACNRRLGEALEIGIDGRLDGNGRLPVACQRGKALQDIVDGEFETCLF